MPEMSSKNQPQLVYMSNSCRCSSSNLSARDFLVAGQRPGGVAGEKSFSGCRRAVEDHFDVSIAGKPDIFEIIRGLLLPQRCHRIAQAVESVAQRRAPLLIPTAMGAGVATAIAPPTVDAVGATPGSFFGDLDFVGGRMSFEKLTVVGQARQLFGFDLDPVRRPAPCRQTDDDGHNFRHRWRYGPAAANRGHRQSRP